MRPKGSSALGGRFFQDVVGGTGENEQEQVM
jgi:hypothetical protein